jgi:diguanylate cyclase (GGDEF)-like protein
MNEQGKPSILIVDDTPTNIRVLADALRADYYVRIATNGAAALEIISKYKPVLVLLDVMMPDMDGYEVCRRIKQHPETRDIPVIFVTAKAEVLDEEVGLDLGAVDYITKPFHLAIVKARVRNHVNLKLKSDLLESLAHIDGLTGISNRRRFDEALELEWKRAQRNQTPLSLVLMDIDFFKYYNDNYGHGMGDICLKQVATALFAGITRPADLLARYGGEEFIALLPNTDIEGARMIAERLRGNVEALQLTHVYSDVAAFVTISAGLASLSPEAQDTAQNLLNQADQMLYRAKEAGRNRVCAVK